jgi:hypothetical protein
MKVTKARGVSLLVCLWNVVLIICLCVEVEGNDLVNEFVEIRTDVIKS